jgi:hypothetical protein
MRNKDDESSESKASAQEIWERVARLDGEPIGVREACEKYDLSPTTVYTWIRRGYVRVLEEGGRGRGNKRLLNEADLAYAGGVADTRGRQQGRTIITDEYVPPHARESS